MRPAWCLVLLFCAACLDNAGPEDFPAQEIRVLSAPEGPRFPTDTLDSVVAVQVMDERGNPSPGRPVAWSATHGGLLLAASDVTDAHGVARAVWILGVVPGTQTATATVTSSDLSISIPVETAGWRVAAVSASRGNHACAIDLAGETYCWSGSLSATPVRIESTARFRALATGQRHTCGLTETGRVYCWGSNDAGQLGDGTTLDRSVPAGPLLPDMAFRSVVAGDASTCALATTGVAWCWGGNRLGILGRGFASEFEATPAPVVGGPAWRAISISGWATCGIDFGRRVYCWGEDDQDGPAILSPTPVEDFQADTVALSDWAKCALSLATLYCWGSDSGIDSPRIMGPRMTSISAGYKPIFGLGADGFGYYWGAVPNSSYGWGDPPTRFEGDLRFRAVGGNDYAPLAIELETSTLYQWSGYQFDAVRRPLTPTPVRPPGS
ncbi:MAG TPA: Ig-like domain-containing protein [Gemmatimonadales bacterium]|nr:Ig-like domain-containing protein [Gemmatimonadales bacterium]